MKYSRKKYIKKKTKTKSKNRVLNKRKNITKRKQLVKKTKKRKLNKRGNKVRSKRRSNMKYFRKKNSKKTRRIRGGASPTDSASDSEEAKGRRGFGFGKPSTPTPIKQYDKITIEYNDGTPKRYAEVDAVINETNKQYRVIYNDDPKKNPTVVQVGEGNIENIRKQGLFEQRQARLAREKTQKAFDINIGDKVMVKTIDDAEVKLSAQITNKTEIDPNDPTRTTYEVKYDDNTKGPNRDGKESNVSANRIVKKGYGATKLANFRAMRDERNKRLKKEGEFKSDKAKERKAILDQQRDLKLQTREAEKTKQAERKRVEQEQRLEAENAETEWERQSLEKYKEALEAMKTAQNIDALRKRCLQGEEGDQTSLYGKPGGVKVCEKYVELLEKQIRAVGKALDAFKKSNDQKAEFETLKKQINNNMEAIAKMSPPEESGTTVQKSMSGVSSAMSKEPVKVGGPPTIASTEKSKATMADVKPKATVADEIPKDDTSTDSVPA